MTIFYFTATGNSLAVAKKIGEGNDAKLVSIPQVAGSDNTHFVDDVIGIVFPVYYLTVPNIVKRFLKKAKFEAEYLFAIGTHGGMPGATMRVVNKMTKANGAGFHYFADVKTAGNYIPMYELSKELESLTKYKVEKQVEKIKADISNKAHKKAKAGLFGRMLTSIFGSGKSYYKYPLKYIIDEKCNKCGICAKVCPVKNITVADSITFDNKCEACLACLNLCPQNAMHHKTEKSSARWKHPDVSLQEIIAANNRGQD